MFVSLPWREAMVRLINIVVGTWLPPPPFNVAHRFAQGFWRSISKEVCFPGLSCWWFIPEEGVRGHWDRRQVSCLSGKSSLLTAISFTKTNPTVKQFLCSYSLLRIKCVVKACSCVVRKCCITCFALGKVVLVT